VDAFTAEFTISAKVNSTFKAVPQRDYFPLPFILSPEFGIFKGKIAFNYNTSEIRLDIEGDDDAPYKYQTTTIVSTNNGANCYYGAQQFNCSAAVYSTEGSPDRCWSYVYNSYLPNQMGANMNLQYIGTDEIDGYLCLVWEASGLYSFPFTIYVRVNDLATVEIDLPYVMSEAVPFLSILGNLGGTTYIRFTEIVVGKPNPSNFYPPSCNGNDSTSSRTHPFSELFQNQYRNTTNWFNDIIDSAVNQAEKALNLVKHRNRGTGSSISSKKKINKQKNEFDEKRATVQNFPPPLNPTFSATYLFNASQYSTTGLVINGKLAFDFTESGFAYSVDSIQSGTTFDLQTEFRVSPSRTGWDLLQVGPDGNCHDYMFFQWIWSILLPNFQIPPFAVQMPNQKVNGYLCSVWSFGDAMLYVRIYDSIIVQFEAQFSTFGYTTVTFSNLKDTVDPARYSRPSTCVEILGWSHNWASHLYWGWCGPFCCLIMPNIC